MVLTDQAFRVRVLESGRLKVRVMDDSVHSVASSQIANKIGHPNGVGI